MQFTRSMLPDDVDEAILAGRLLLDAGPTPVLIRDGAVEDVSRSAPTVSDLMDLPGTAVIKGERLFDIDDLDRLDPSQILAPVDLQAVKAAGVTFAVSAVERVIEEKARGDYRLAGEIRDRLEQRIGGAIRSVAPGSDGAARLKGALIEDGLWSQYLEVAIGPDAEIFTKTAPLASVGWGAEIGVRSDSSWNNPEPEVVLVVNSRGDIRGATLGNDVNLRDFEGRSALLLGRAKDNNASCAIGPFVRLFDDAFTIDTVRGADLALTVEGSDGFTLAGSSSIRQISRDPLDLVGQAIGANHQYPDGFVLFLGTMFAPTQDRHAPGLGFTHEVGDLVTIATPSLGALVNRVEYADAIAPWTFGASALMRNLAARGLLTPRRAVP
jgi:fumarylacetoacetate (FAA) hydrolase family protein